MSGESEHILAEALQLPPVERAELVERILSSFEFSSREDLDATWAKEAEDRIEGFEAGKIRAIPARRVFENIDKREAE